MYLVKEGLRYYCGVEVWVLCARWVPGITLHILVAKIGD